MSTRLESIDDIVLTATELLDALAAHEQQAALLALAVRRLETSGEWAADGSVSMVAWLRHHGRLSQRDAARWVRRGRFLDRFPVIADAAVSRSLAAGQVAALQHACPVALEPVLAGQARELVGVLAPLSVADTETACAVWRHRAEAVVDLPEPGEPERELRMRRAGDGALIGSFVLDDPVGVELQQAIRTASTWEGSGDTRTPGRVSADALFDIAAFYNNNHHVPGTPRHRPHVELSIDATTLDDRPEAIDADGRLVHHTTTDTHLCDCVLHRVLRDPDNLPTSYGRSRYTVPRHLFRLVAARDGGCRYPGCNRSVRHCDAHHIRHWRHHGTTDHDNLILLCTRHHHHVHQTGLDLTLLANGEVHITRPDGTHHTSQPRGAPPHQRRTP